MSQIFCGSREKQQGGGETSDKDPFSKQGVVGASRGYLGPARMVFTIVKTITRVSQIHVQYTILLICLQTPCSMMKIRFDEFCQYFGTPCINVILLIIQGHVDLLITTWRYAKGSLTLAAMQSQPLILLEKKIVFRDRNIFQFLMCYMIFFSSLFFCYPSIFRPD